MNVTYENAKRLLQGVESRWDRRGKGYSGNLDNLNEIANFFEVPLRTYYSAVVRKTGPDGQFLFGGRNEDGTQNEARTNLKGHVFVHGTSDVDLTLSSCIRREGFGWTLEISERKVGGEDCPEYVGYAWEDTLLVVNMKRLAAFGHGRVTEDGNRRFNLQTIADGGFVTDVMMVDGDQLVTPTTVFKMTQRPNQQYQDFKLKGRNNVSQVILVRLDTGEKAPYSCKKALWTELKAHYGYTRTYDNFRIMVNKDSKRIQAGEISQRPNVYSDPRDPECRFMVVNRETEADLDVYLKMMNDRSERKRSFFRRRVGGQDRVG
jgi:hypothetical protein